MSLTREQVEQRCYYIRHMGGCSVYADDILAHDAALRQELEEIKVERDRWYLAAQERIRIHNELEHYQVQLRQRVGKLEQELRAWKHSAIGEGVLEQELADLHAKLAVVEGERVKALEAIYIPGSWACTQCEFGQVITNLYINSGTVGPNTEEVPICPNDGSLMRRSTWKGRVMDDDKYITKKLDEIDALQHQLAEAREWRRARDAEWAERVI